MFSDKARIRERTDRSVDNRPRRSTIIRLSRFQNSLGFSLSLSLLNVKTTRYLFDKAMSLSKIYRDRYRNQSRTWLFTIYLSIPFHSRFILLAFLFLPYPPTRIFSSKTYRHGFFSAPVIYQSRSLVLSPPPLSFDTRELSGGFRQRDGHGERRMRRREGRRRGEKGASVPPSLPSFFLFPRKEKRSFRGR